MSLMSLLEKITGKQKQREKARIDDFRTLVRTIGAGKEPDADQVERILVITGKSVEDLRAAVELYQQRFALRTQLNSLSKLTTERKEIEQQMAKANEALEEAERQHEETMNPLIRQHEIVRQAMQEAERARQQLIDTCPFDELCERSADLQRRHVQVHDQASKQRQTISDCRGWAKADRATAAHASHSRKEHELLERANRRDAHADQCEKELAEVLKQVTAMEQQIQAVRNEMLEP